MANEKHALRNPLWGSPGREGALKCLGPTPNLPTWMQSNLVVSRLLKPRAPCPFSVGSWLPSRPPRSAAMRVK